MSKCHENCVGKQACVQLIRDAEARVAKKAEAELQEKLRQQREACADAWVSECYEDNKCTVEGIFVYEAILDAKIGNNGEEG